MSLPETKVPVVRFRSVSKEFPGVLAVDCVDLDILPGEVHVVAGENGAGKSTLMKLLSQVELPSYEDLFEPFMRSKAVTLQSESSGGKIGDVSLGGSSWAINALDECRILHTDG